ncbi:Glutathione hydrolase 7 [Frankliniella fusca]|uniref:Glutathione hydrolase 7 n=1 Tax=Frankliniella fusca TaxID=407009 RepID=A0AAE1LGB3_9NEOP|nr:Glutathione hydrolase 7 [Frankliniella fusca]
MEAMRESTTVTDTGTTVIPDPYARPERTESIPLKGASSPSSSFISRICQNCLGFADDDAGDGLKFIIVTFFFLSVAVTVALAAQIYHGDFQVVPHGSVAADSKDCAIIGTDILKKGGNAVDAAVATTFCMGVVNPHITGLGGGGFMLVYDHRRREVLESLDFRETAPLSQSTWSPDLTGPNSVGVPGLVRGLFAAHKSRGKLGWEDVVRPAADLARNGFLVPSSLVTAKTHLNPRDEYNARIHDLVDTLEAGQILKLPSLASSLELIGREGPGAFYNGSIALEILSAVTGSSLTEADLFMYQPVTRESLQENFYGFDIIVPGAPSGGPLLLAALKSIQALNLSKKIGEESTPLLLLRQAQAIQQNYAAFYSESGDPNFSATSTPGTATFSPPETVASHVTAIDLNDLYVSVVSGHNSLFGSQVMTEGGFLLNNALTSFNGFSAGTKRVSAGVHFPMYPKPSNIINITKDSEVPEDDALLDHHSEATAVPHLDASAALPLEKQPGFHQSESLSVRRFKRSENTESEPRATVWGSSVANNELVGGKRPISLSVPVIAIESGQICGLRLVLGGSDASVVAQVLSNLLVLDGNLISSIESPRVRLSASGSNFSLEQSYVTHLSPLKRQQLVDLGVHIQSPATLNPSVNIVEKLGDALNSHSDSRGEGVASRF